MAINYGPTLASNIEDFCAASKPFLKQMEGFGIIPMMTVRGILPLVLASI